MKPVRYQVRFKRANPSNGSVYVGETFSGHDLYKKLSTFLEEKAPAAFWPSCAAQKSRVYTP